MDKKCFVYFGGTFGSSRRRWQLHTQETHLLQLHPDMLEEGWGEWSPRFTSLKGKPSQAQCCGNGHVVLTSTLCRDAKTWALQWKTVLAPGLAAGISTWAQHKRFLTGGEKQGKLFSLLIFMWMACFCAALGNNCPSEQRVWMELDQSAVGKHLSPSLTDQIPPPCLSGRK